MFLYILICEYLHLRYDTSHQNKPNKLLEYISIINIEIIVKKCEAVKKLKQYQLD